MPETFLPIELATAIPLGTEDGLPIRAVPPATSARQALEDCLLRALSAGPCVITFSGGRDSSALLALAASVARREGLPLPLPATLRFASDPASHEDEWQESIVRHLRLTEWNVLDLENEVDLVGPLAQQVLAAHGLVWPPNSHFQVPAMRLASGGTLVNGVGGDQILSAARYRRVSAVLHGQARPGIRDLGRVAFAYGPRQLRQYVSKRQETPDISWLTRQGQEVFEDAYARASAAEPIAWDRWIRKSWWRNRIRLVTKRSIEAVASDHDCAVVSPFEDESFLAAIAQEKGPLGFTSRTGAMEELFDDVLPRATLERRTKAGFNSAFWGPESRSLAATWRGGEGVPSQHVDEERLSEEWAAEWVDGRSTWMLQQVWLTRHQSGGASSRSPESR